MHRLSPCASIVVMAAAVVVGAWVGGAQAQWVDGGMPVCTAPMMQQYASITTDDQGGAIIVWQDQRDSATTGLDVYAQRLSHEGVPQWTPGGVPVCTLPTDQQTVGIVPDGAHGAIMVWEDARSGTHWDLYAQRIRADGSVLWDPGGVRMSQATTNQWLSDDPASIVADGMGGAIMSWEVTYGFNSDTYAQRVSADGSKLWGPSGTPVGTAPSFQTNSALFADSTGGAFIVWEDYRVPNTPRIYAQRLDSLGGALWGDNGFLVSNPTTDQGYPNITADGHGGALMVWTDYLQHQCCWAIFAQRIDGSGNTLWAPGGIPVCVEAGPREEAVALQDRTGDFIVAWADDRTGWQASDYDIYAQRLGPDGTPQWAQNGVPICVEPGEQYGISLVPDAEGGTILVWFDVRGGLVSDAYAQRLDATGATRWASDGIPLSSTTAVIHGPLAIGDGAGGAIAAWMDSRNGKYDPPRGGSTNFDIYAAHVSNQGTLAASLPATPLAPLLAVRPNPTEGPLSISFRLAAPGAATVEVVDVSGHRVRTLTAGSMPAGDHALAWDGRDAVGQRVPAGLYFIRLHGPATATRKVIVVR